MKRLFAAGFVLATILGICSLFSGTASATPVVSCVPGTVVVSGNTAKITNDPDSGNHTLDWATDNFTRTTDIINNCNNSYTVNVHDTGTFTTVPGGQSPRQGLPLPLTPITGTFTGSTNYAVTSRVAPSNPSIAAIDGSPHTSAWWSRFFTNSDESHGTEQAWSWTYKTCSEKWVDADSSNGGADATDGDITGKECKVVPPPTTTIPPPTTTDVPPTTIITITQPPATTVIVNNGGTGGSVGDGSDAAQVTSVPVGAPATGFGGAQNNDGIWLWSGIGALVAASVLFGYVLFRRGTRVTQ